jgi:hypothetical protein
MDIEAAKRRVREREEEEMRQRNAAWDKLMEQRRAENDGKPANGGKA